MVFDLLSTFLEAEITLEKIHHLKEWINKYVLGGGKISGSTTYRNYYLKEFLRKDRFKFEE
jgi:hypothetical protein